MVATISTGERRPSSPVPPNGPRQASGLRRRSPGRRPAILDITSMHWLRFQRRPLRSLVSR